MCARKESMSAPVPTERGLVLRRLRELRELAGLSQEQLAGYGVRFGLAEVSRKRISEAENGATIGARTAGLLAEKLSEKLARTVTVEDLVGAEKDSESRNARGEWDPIAPPEPFTLAPNGLQWRVQKLKHTSVHNRYGRGKFYDLSHLTSTHQSDFQKYLVARHAEVCDAVGAHPNIARNLSVYQEPTATRTWWVVDEWLEAPTLEECLERGPLPAATLKRTMKDVAAGLARFHEVGIVRRNLTPASVLLTEGAAVLTDFELARLPGNVPTVSANAQWRGNDYLAPEVPGGVKPLPSADLYSWSMVLAHAATGQAPKTPALAMKSLANAGLPAKVTDFAQSCILRPANKRPQTAEAALAVVNEWT